MSSPIFSRLDEGKRGVATILGIPMCTMVGDKIELKDVLCEITNEIHDVLSSTGYTGQSMKEISVF